MDAPRPLRHAGFAVVRTPALPMREWLAHAAAAGAGDAWQGRADSARALFRRPLVAGAIYVASPSFHARLKRWDWRLRGADDRKMLAAFERYLNRMCFRATPFGVFSTVSYAPLKHSHGWTLDDAAAQAPIERAVRIDGEALCELCEKLHNGAADPDMRYTVNASLYRVGDGYRFVDWSLANHGDRAYQIGEIDGHPLIDALVERMGDRLLDTAGIASLVDELARAEDIDLPALIDDLIAARVLLPALSPDPLHAAPSAALAGALSRHPAHAHKGERLAQLNASLRAIPADHALEHYMHADREIREFTGADPAGLSLQVDAFRRHPLMAVDAAMVDEATHALDWLLDRFSVRHGPLDSFCDAFVQRYGSGMVPLMEALDPECGVGYGQTAVSNRLLASLGITTPAAARTQVTLSPLDQHLLALVQRDPSLLSAPEIAITREGAASLPLTRDGHGGSGMAMVLHFPMMHGERTIALDGIDPDGAVNWFSRFGHGEERIVDASRTFAREVEADDGEQVLHAEIGHLAQARSVNLLSRAPVWSWRINLADPAIEAGRRDLPVSDLMVCVAGKNIQLWSRRLRKRVIPHLTSAHNAADPVNPPVYRFLCALRSHGMRMPRLAWGGLFKRFDYLPRLRFEAVVIAPARWRIPKASLAALQDGPALRALLAERRAPRHVELVEGDNRLVLDLDDPIDIAQLLRAAKKGQDLLLAEVLDDFSDTDPAWRHELVVPLYRPSQTPTRQPAFERDLDKAPFSEALYVKLYGGQETLDKHVLPELAAWTAQQRQQGAIGDWFFIRYADPGWHLRLRVFPHDGAVLARLVRLVEQLRERGWITRFEFASYERETIRYGGREHIGVSEALFCIDSELATAILACGDATPRWSAALLAIDALLRDFGMSPGQKLALAEMLASGYREEFKLAKPQQGALGDLYRRHAREMLASLRRDERAPAWSRRLWQLLDGVSANRRALATPLLSMDQNLSIVSSHVHMLCNRLFVSQSREFEVPVYDFLARAYRALAAMPARRAE